MTDTYDLDALDEMHSSTSDTGESRSDDANGTSTEDTSGAGTDEDGPVEDPLGVPVPEEHVGAFVAETFEDAERNTTWEQVVDEMVAPSARDAWDALEPAEQVAEVLSMADSYDHDAADILADIEVDDDEASEQVRDAFEEAMRLRRNADALRDGVAAAFAEGYVDDEGLVTALENSDFDTETIARREDELERVTSVYDLDYRPYGGTLIQESEASPSHSGGPETF